MRNFSIDRDYTAHTVTLAFDGVLDYSISDGWDSKDVTVVLSSTDFDALISSELNAFRPPHTRGFRPLTWRTQYGHTPESVRRSNSGVPYSYAAVKAMLDAADEAHKEAIYAENAAGGGAAREEARKLRRELDSLRHDHAALEARNLGLINAHAKMTEERDQATEQRDAWKEAVEAMDAKHVRPLRQELAELREAHEECRAKRRAERAAAPRIFWHTTAEEYTHTDEELRALAESVALQAPAGSLVAELRAVIVSQAREIAKLKGESE